jgi:branched-chain amino acid transport system permease protein
MKQRYVWAGLALAVLAAVPFALPVYPVTLLIEVMSFALFTLGINVLLGYTGFISVGHAMFLGFGGYGIGVLCLLFKWPVWLAIVATLVTCAVLGFAIGAICMRVGRIPFLVITLAMSQMFYGIAVKVPWTNGDDGMAGVPRLDLGWLGLETGRPAGFYFYALAYFVVFTWLLWRIVRSPFGSVLVGIRENEKRMVALGYDVTLYKNLAFMLSGVMAGAAGILFAQFQQFVNPDIMRWEISGEGLLMVIIGGRQYFLGPIVGAAFFVLAKAQLAAVTEEYIIFFGLFFMLVVALFRTGLAGFALTLWRRWRPPAGSAQAPAALGE